MGDQDKVNLERDITEETSAVNLYEGQKKGADPKVAKVLDHVIEQEREHMEEFSEAVRSIGDSQTSAADEKESLGNAAYGSPIKENAAFKSIEEAIEHLSGCMSEQDYGRPCRKCEQAQKMAEKQNAQKACPSCGAPMVVINTQAPGLIQRRCTKCGEETKGEEGLREFGNADDIPKCSDGHGFMKPLPTADTSSHQRWECPECKTRIAMLKNAGDGFPCDECGQAPIARVVPKSDGSGSSYLCQKCFDKLGPDHENAGEIPQSGLGFQYAAKTTSELPKENTECLLCKGKGVDPVRGGPCPECTMENADKDICPACKDRLCACGRCHNPSCDKIKECLENERPPFASGDTCIDKHTGKEVTILNFTPGDAAAYVQEYSGFKYSARTTDLELKNRDSRADKAGIEFYKHRSSCQKCNDAIMRGGHSSNEEIVKKLCSYGIPLFEKCQEMGNARTPKCMQCKGEMKEDVDRNGAKIWKCTSCGWYDWRNSSSDISLPHEREDLGNSKYGSR